VQGPQGVPGVSPFYVAGWILGTATVQSGTGFTVQRFGPTGSYQVQVPQPPSKKMLIPAVSTFAPNTVARIVSWSRDGLTGTTTIIIEVHTVDTNTLVDGDLLLIVAERS
jgi:hypothetical protein